MSELPLIWMAAAFRKNGLQVREVKGWKTRGRQQMFAPRGVVFHHTASNRNAGADPSLAICVHGRSDLPGPLCNVLVARDGTVYVIAAGRTNHAGLGGAWRNIPKNSGNAYLAGVEVENNGIGEPWPERQLRACDQVFATLLVGLRRRESWLCGHKEWAPKRKIDPANIDLDDYRLRVRKAIRELAVRERDKGDESTPRKKPDAKRPVQPASSKTRVHVVAEGDTLWGIARRYGMKVEELKRLNLLKRDLIHPGDRLKVGRNR
jgi:LysM repeat protein